MAELDEILYQLGVYPTQRGYQITNMAVTIGWREPEKLQMLTKWLYPAVALKCGCSNAPWNGIYVPRSTEPGIPTPVWFHKLRRGSLPAPPTAGDFVWMLCRYLTEKQEGA